MIRYLTALVATVLLTGTASAQQVPCPVKIGGILPLTGSMAPITKKISEAALLAIEHINAGGGIKGCPVQFILRDDQGQPTVGVDAAKYLVEVERVQAITGTVSSGVTGPIIASVTAPSKVVQISCCSTASPFTAGWAQPGLFLPHPPDQQDPGLCDGLGDGAPRPQEDGDHLREHRLRPGHEPLRASGPAEARRRDRDRGAIQRQSAELPGRGDQGARCETGVAAADRLPQGRRDDRARVAVARRFAEDRAQQFDAREGFRRRRGRAFPATSSFGMDNAQVAGPQVDVFNKAFEAKYKYDSKGPGVHTQYDAVMALAPRDEHRHGADRPGDQGCRAQDPHGRRHNRRHGSRGVQEGARADQGGQADPLFRRHRPVRVRSPTAT